MEKFYYLKKKLIASILTKIVQKQNIFLLITKKKQQHTQKKISKYTRVLVLDFFAHIYINSKQVTIGNKWRKRRNELLFYFILFSIKVFSYSSNVYYTT